MNPGDPRWDDPDYDISGDLVGEEVDYDYYDPIEEMDWDRAVQE